jgi:microcystin-dependent protein
MSDQFVAEIRIYPFNFAPKGWAFCSGQILPISQNTALFSLLGTTYGGDGKSNFALPNLQGNAPMFYGQGPGLSLHDIGETGGTATVSLLQSEMPAHSHTMMGYGTPPPANGGTPDPTVALARSSGGAAYKQAPYGAVGAMDPSALAVAGGGQPHNNMMPYLTLNFCIALQGIFPPR